MDWTENNALVDWVTPCSSHIPKASTRLEIRTSVKHGLDQILTSTQPARSHSCQLGEHWPPQRVCLVSSDTFVSSTTYVSPYWDELESFQLPAFAPTKRESVGNSTWVLISSKKLLTSQLSIMWATLTSTSIVFGVIGHRCCSIRVVSVSLLKCHLSGVTRPPLLLSLPPSRPLATQRKSSDKQAFLPVTHPPPPLKLEWLQILPLSPWSSLSSLSSARKGCESDYF